MSEPIIVSVRGRSAITAIQAMGRYGNKWRAVETDGRSFFCHGRPILPPPDWKVICAVWPIAAPKLPRKKPTLRLVAS